MSNSYPSWYRRRGYLHFDLPLGFKKAKAVATNPKHVESHSFYPFINYTITAEKIAKDPGTLKLINVQKSRPIAYAAHIDSHIYAYYSKIISKSYEPELYKRGLSDTVLAFRSLGKSNIDFASEAFSQICAYGSCGVVGLDVTGFFDNLDHGILKDKWSYLLGDSRLPNDHFSVFKSLTRWSSVDRNNLYQLFGISKNNPKNDRYRVCSPADFRAKVRDSGLIKTNTKSKGIPQGSPISALLSNIYMIDFDQEVNNLISDHGGRYYRYCDDMLFIVPAEWRDKIVSEIVTRLEALKLDINTKKTERRTFSLVDGKLVSDKPLQYLGFLFDGRNVTIRSAALARYSERMRRGVRLAKLTKIKRNRLKIAAGKKPSKIYKHKLYEKYSHLGKRNFIRYGLKAAEKMSSEAIRKQLKPLWRRLNDEIDKT